MKNIWKIFTRDIKKLVKQPFALIIIIGLCVIPSLYAWFNIFANWDPYANTGGIPVAVVSLDQVWALLTPAVPAASLLPASISAASPYVT